MIYNKFNNNNIYIAMENQNDEDDEKLESDQLKLEELNKLNNRLIVVGLNSSLDNIVDDNIKDLCLINQTKGSIKFIKNNINEEIKKISSKQQNKIYTIEKKTYLCSYKKDMKDQGIFMLNFSNKGNMTKFFDNDNFSWYDVNLYDLWSEEYFTQYINNFFFL